MTPRDERLAVDFQEMESLAKASTIFSFEASGEPADRYTFRFKGRGISRESSPRAKLETVELHECDVRMPAAYPQREPDIRWVTPIYHPNVSFSGFISLEEIGLEWSPDLPLRKVCERLWDVARVASLDLDAAVNYSARSWFEEHGESSLSLPIDTRPLSDKSAATSNNIVKYSRRGRLSLPAQQREEILFIGDDSVPPQEARRPAWPWRGVQQPGDDDIIFIDE